MRRLFFLLLLIVGVVLASDQPPAQAAPPPAMSLSNRPALPVADMLLEADALRVGGNYPAAISLYQKVLAEIGSPPSDDNLPAARSALYSLAQTYGLDQNTPLAVESWQKFAAAYRDDARYPLALLQYAIALRQQNDTAGASWLTQAYNDLAPAGDPLMPYVALTLADTYRQTDQLPLAVAEFKHALGAPALLPAVRVRLGQQLGQTLALAGDYAGAVQAFDAVLGDTALISDPILKAIPASNARSQLQLAAGRALKMMGQTDEAIARFRRVIADAPDGDAAPQAVEELTALTPNDFNFYLAGLVYYYRRRWDTAITWLRRSLSEQADTELTRTYLAKSYEMLSQQDRAIREWSDLIAKYPSSARVGEARFERADDYHRLGNDVVAIQQYRQLAADYPGTSRGEAALFAIAGIYESADKFAEAARQYEVTQAAFPKGSRASEALTAAGYDRIRVNDLSGAKTTLEKAISLYPQSSWRSKALFWLGKIAQKQGRAADANANWLAASRASADYYGLRGLDMAQKTVPLGSERKAFGLPTAFPGDQHIMERWLRSWAAPTDEATGRRSLAALRPEIVTDLGWQRGRLLAEIGMWPEARAELRAVADRYVSDPITQYQLALAFQEIGLYDLSLLAGWRIYWAWPEEGLNRTPRFLQRLAYPAPYSSLIVSEAQKNGFDPLLYFALVFQESNFYPGSISSAVARGLTQVIPGTARDIATALRKSNFQQNDLYKPYVSLEFGAYYFGAQYRYFEKDYMMALAGYNGGPGNASRWKNADVDVAVENVSLTETRAYVRRIYEHYWYYRQLY
ncbi:MAG: transglycosylase SLT domain-containing protein [Chloroflexi bacterium]|nr:transglycosylase SLT domain-containing protein [Chloroflexota bacterium]